MMRYLKIAGFVLCGFLGLFILFVLFATITDYSPEEKIVLYSSDSPDTLKSGQYNAFCWNIGYAGLDQGMDFFYDGGKRVRSSQEQTRENLEFIKNFITGNESADFILLQEVDFKSKRTYRTNEFEAIDLALKNHRGWFAPNYKVIFVPVPPSHPMGKVNSGLAFFSRYEPSLVERIDFPGKYSWPTRLFMLDRCFLAARFPLENGNHLIIINSHNSAFDDGSLKKQEMEYLRNYITKEQKLGNRIVIGADWNQNPPGISPDYFLPPPVFEKFTLQPISTDYLPEDWTWCYDPHLPTNRNLREAYSEGKTFTTILDFYLLSPGIECVSVQTINLHFRHADHQPVLLVFDSQN